MSYGIQLQQILGTDKRNPSFTICRDEEAGCLHVYYGGEMFEKVPDNQNDPQHKMMVARLYNAGVNAVKLREAFGVDRKTMRSWGDALKSGDPEKLRTWSSCSVPLDLVVCRDSQDESLEEAWGILSTARDESKAAPAATRYHLRVLIEERHRHLKCFWDLAEFTSPCFALVVNQVTFTALTYSLLQQQILRQGRKALNKASKSRMLEELVPVSEHVIVYTDHYYAVFNKLDYTDMVLDVPESARQKLRELIARKRSRTRLSTATDASP